MKKFLLCAAGLFVLSMGAPASAADAAPQPYGKSLPIAVALYNWSGFYLGANGGWASSHKCWDFAGNVAAPLAVIVADGCHDATGGVIGGQIGYNWQTTPNWLFGLEAQGDWANLRGSSVSLAFPIFTNRSRIDGLGLFTARIGYAWNNTLLYVKGGAAVVHDRYNYFLNGAVVDTGTASETRWGGVVGVGLEYGFAPNWSVGLEYDHVFLDASNITFASPAQTIHRIHQDVDMITARLNYRFGVGRY